MKKIIMLVLLSFLLAGVVEAKENSWHITSSKESLSSKGKKNKSGRYRKKKGFMWGLFKGRNQCDCPKH